MKTCTKCKESKEMLEFYNNKRIKDGKSAWCKACHNSAAVEWGRNNPDRLKVRWLKQKYGLDYNTYMDMENKHGGKCPTCGAEAGKKLQVDHCHATGKVRGLLCFSCNAALGSAKDNAETLKNLIKYLEDTK